jgi:methylmalonyl-CoA/ethylmalonyl-CoA epimerase
MKIDHLGIATREIAEALSFWRDSLGLELDEVEEVTEQKVRVAMLPLGESRVELLEPTAPDSPIAKFLEKRGPGLHHIAIRVEDILQSLDRLKRQGARLIDESPRLGAGGSLVAFVHPSSANGVLLELVQPKAERLD